MDPWRLRTAAKRAAAHLDPTGSGDLARRLACHAGLLPAVLDGTSQILDWGTSKRFATPAQRRALALRDGGCTFRGCDRPPSWCEAHHLIPWEHDGPSDLNNFALVCDAHHDLLHHDGWTIHLDHNGLPVWDPPAEPPPDEPHPPGGTDPPDASLW